MRVNVFYTSSYHGGPGDGVRGCRTADPSACDRLSWSEDIDDGSEVGERCSSVGDRGGANCNCSSNTGRTTISSITVVVACRNGHMDTFTDELREEEVRFPILRACRQSRTEDTALSREVEGLPPRLMEAIDGRPEEAACWATKFRPETLRYDC